MTEKETVTVAGVPVTAQVDDGVLSVTVGRFDLAAAGGLLYIDPRFGKPAVSIYLASENGDPGQRCLGVFDLHPGSPGTAVGRSPGSGDDGAGECGATLTPGQRHDPYMATCDRAEGREPRAAGDGIAVDISTRAGEVTVQFTGREQARACPAAGQAFTYRGRQYGGSMFLSGPGWQGSSSLGLSLHPAGGPAGPSVAAAIASIVGAAVAAYLRAHPNVLDLAAQARARATQARAVRDLELLTLEITAAEERLARLRRKEAQLRKIARNNPQAHPA